MKKLSALILLFSLFSCGYGVEYIIVDLENGGITEYNAAPNDLLSSEAYKTNKMVLRYIKSGTFMMGAPLNEKWRDINNKIETQHKVSLTKDYYIGVFEVTQGQYELLMGSNPSKFKNIGPSAPVESVNWADARGGTWPDGNKEPSSDSFVGKLRALTNHQFDLPTEAQWEYACRAGTREATYVGDLNVGKNPELEKIAWFNIDSNPKLNSGTHPVGLKKPNAWGLYDMLGNVGEWCLDNFSEFNDQAVVDPTGTEYKIKYPESRILRGGSWFLFPGFCRSGNRYYDNATIPGWPECEGFRVVMNIGD